MQPNKEELQKLIKKLDVLIEEALQLEHKFAAQVGQVHPAFRKSTINLLHYLGLRRHDIRKLQAQLAQLGLSSLGRSEGHVMANLQAVRRQLKLAEDTPAAEPAPIISFAESAPLIRKHTDNLLGPALPDRRVRIMVTFATEMAADYPLVLQMMQAGMNCARINLAHDDKRVWEKMVENIKQAEKESGLGCKILFDLMGPKLRTGPLKPGPKQIMVQPLRNEVGQIITPAQVWLTSGSTAKIKPDATLPVTEDWLNQVQVDDQIKFKDTRGRKRTLYVKSKDTGGVVAHLFKTSYLGTGTQLTNQNPAATIRSVGVGELPNMEIPLLLHRFYFILGRYVGVHFG
jgi:pyruvate kinase